MKKFFPKGFQLFIAGLMLTAAALMLESFFLPKVKQWYLQTRLDEIQKELWQKEAVAEDLLNEAVKYAPERLFVQQERLYNTSQKENVLLYVYDGPNLLLWTSNNVFPERTNFSKRSFIQTLDNGTYLQKNIRSHGLSFITLIPVKYTYPFENKYIQNRLALYPADDIDMEVSLVPLHGARAIYSHYGEYLFSLQASMNKQSIDWIGLLFIAGLLCLILFVHRSLLLLMVKRKNGAFATAAISFFAFIVLIWKVFRIPKVIFSWPLFSANYFATSYLFSSLGDLLVFTALLCYAIWLISRFQLKKEKSRQFWKVETFILITGLFSFAGFMENLIESLVLDSQISFDLSNIFGLSVFSLLGLLVIFSWLFCFFRIARQTVNRLRKLFHGSGELLLFIGLAVMVSLALLAVFKELHWLSVLFSVIALLILYLLPDRNEEDTGFTRPALFILLTSLFIAMLLTHYNRQNQQENMRVISSRLATERDAVAEYLFSNIYNGLRNDSYLKNYFQSPIASDKILSKRIRQLYFSGYFSKYDVDVRSFTAEGSPYKTNTEKPLQYYYSLLKESATPVRGNYLFFLHNYSGLPTYLTVIPVYMNGGSLGTILIQLQQKAFYEESIYPELLLSENIERFKELSNYSYAVYNNHILLTQKGNYAYPGIAEFSFSQDSSGYLSTMENGYYHLIHQISPSMVVVVSTPTKPFMYYTSVFSFLFLFFSICWLGLKAYPYVSNWFRQINFSRFFMPWKFSFFWQDLSFRNKILLTILAGMTLSLLAIGIVTVYYIERQYSSDEMEKLRKKSRYVTTELETRLQDIDPANRDNDEEINSFIKDLSHSYQSDINVFDVNGNLVSTTQELIYESEVMAPKMDPLAYLKFYAHYATQVIQEEKIGQLKYTSSYMPLRNMYGDIIGFVNLPYFSKEQELDERISSFLVALINLYLLLFLVLLAVGIFMARGLTVPLDIIRNHLRNMSLSGKNTFIAWHNNDEIGKLVQEYNSMMIALQESAARIAESEREGAWKEMAQQVAHEIKNPLTPMKLNIQRLQRAYEEGDPELDQIFVKVTELLVNQIESLSQIATAFSSFAQMPVEEPRRVDVNKVLLEVSQLYSLNAGINFQVELSKDDMTILADPEQLSRVFNNLVKNAVQAIPEGKKGLIEIESESDGYWAHVHIRDNGCGIPEDIRGSIFKPKFSTKTSGMGLGLAIVKNIIEKAGGTIGFESKGGEGTVFTIKLPLV